jgi:hypothetical protein
MYFYLILYVLNNIFTIMKLSQIYKNLVYTSFSAGIALLCMLMLSLFSNSHITQQHFEIFSPTQSYTSELLASDSLLRTILSFDNIFIVLYSACFIFLYLALSQTERSLNLIIGLFAVLGTGVLDFYENHHILTLLTMAEKGTPIANEDIAHQMTMSQMKFHLSYLSFFLFGFSMPSETLLEKALKYSLLFIQLPIGVLVYTSPDSLKPFFGIARYACMLGGLFMIAYIFYVKNKKLGKEIPF